MTTLSEKIIKILKETPSHTMEWSHIYNLLLNMGYSKSGISSTKARLIQKGIIAQEVIDGRKVIKLLKVPETEKEIEDTRDKLITLGADEDFLSELEDSLERFFMHHMDKYDDKSPWVEIDWKDLAEWFINYGPRPRDDIDPIDLLFECPNLMLELMNKAFEDAYYKCHWEMPKYKVVTLKSVSDLYKRTIEDIRSKDIGRLIEFEGIVAMASKVQSAIVKGVYVCSRCGEIINVPIDPLNPPGPPEKIICSRCGSSGGEAYLDDEMSEYIDYQELKLQQPIETMKNPTDPPKYITVIHENAKGIYSGRVRVIGIPTRIKKKSKKGVFEIIIRAINVIPLDDTSASLNLSEKEVETIKKISKIPNVIDFLSDLLFYKIKGHKEIKKALFLQQVRGISKDPESSGVIHILLITDPGIGKSTMLRTVAKIPGNTYATVTTATGVGLTATVERMKTEIGDDTWVVKPGVIPKAHGGTACLDEFAKKPIDTYLLECMSTEYVTINKASISVALPASTSILAACNPERGKFDPNLTVREQIHISKPILDRFDLIFAIRDVVDEQKDREVLKHILNLYRDHKKRLKDKTPFRKEVEVDGEKIVITENLIHKYILYAKTIEPELSDEADEELENIYIKLRKETKEADIGVSARQIESIIKISGAVAKAKLKKTIDAEDVKEAIDLVMYCYENIAKDDDTIDFSKIFGPPRSKEGKMEFILDTLDELKIMLGGPVPREKLLEECRKRGLDITEEEFDEILDKLKRNGEIYSPKFGMYLPT